MLAVMIRRIFRSKKFLLWMAAVLLVLLVAGVVVERSMRGPDRRELAAAEAAEFKRVLLEQIVKADRITVEEHASAMDSVEGVDDSHIYRTVELNAEQVAQLKELVATVPEAGKEWFMACFIPHHAIRFSQGGKETEVLRVCLDCSGLRMNGTHATEPADLFPRVKDFLAGIGFEGATHLEWHKRAKAVMESRSKGSSAQ